MKEKDIAREERLREARMLAQSAPVLFPMLQQRRELCVQRIIGNHATGVEQTKDIAELYVVDDLITEIQSKLEELKGG